MSDKSHPTNPDKSQTPNPKSHPWWRSLEELASDPAFAERVHNEFPSLLPEDAELADPVARRTFLKLSGAALGLAGLTACTRQPVEAIVPYVRQPEDVVPGKPLFFATAMSLGGVATGLLVESHEGRPTKVEGNPMHPGSLGASDVFAQAAVLGLYDPDRLQTLTNVGEIRPWSAFLGAIRAALVAQAPFKGAGLRILTESVSSPTLAAQIRDLLARYPSAKWHQWDPASRNNARVGSMLAFGEFVDAQYRIDQADVILALDADFLACGPGSLRHAREFAARRNPDHLDRMNRLYAVETMPTPTGSRADHRLPARPTETVAIANAIAGRLRASGASTVQAALNPSIEKWIAAVSTDLQAHRGTSLVIAGDDQPPMVHALAHAMNEALGNAGKTVVYTQAAEAEPLNQIDSLRTLTTEMAAGKVDVLVIIGGNPAFTAPADVPFADAMNKVQLRAHLSLHADETSALCHWQIPEAHFLESWSDARGLDGTASIVQPLIAPLYGGKSAHEVIAALSDRPERSAYDIVREFWKVDPKNDANWRRWLHDGVIPDTAFAPKHVAPRSLSPQPSALSPSSGIELSFKNDPCVLDGRFANNGWLQELPKPITRLTWDNAIMVSPATAAKLKSSAVAASTGGEHGQIVSDVAEVKFNGRSIRGPVLPVAGHPDGCATIHAGYGRARGGHIGTGAGFNAYAIRTTDAFSAPGTGAEIVLTRDTHSLAITQYHHLIEGRGVIHATTRDEYAKNPKSAHEGPGIEEAPGKTITLYPDWKYEGYRWGMAIDINACIGCNACVVGCQAENNIPVVGRDQVLKGREMHWLRVDTYYRGPAENPETYFQPVPCMQCENAPCEVVCPVGATVHSSEGLNDMVYNRCVGTRYCSNNCPYKVRRFNFLLYQDWDTPSLKLGRNPNVSIRSRGVMEKCTYCVQRINAAKIESETHDQKIKDGGVVTACQQACPADAIVFGDLNDPSSRVAKLQAGERNYALLGELNTRPRTTYLAAVRNVNPEVGE